MRELGEDPHPTPGSEPGPGPPSPLAGSLPHAASICLRLRARVLKAEMPNTIILTLTTCSKPNLPPNFLAHLKLSKSPRNLSRSPSGRAACHVLASCPRPRETTAGVEETWVCPAQQPGPRGRGPQPAGGCLHGSCRHRPGAASQRCLKSDPAHRSSGTSHRGCHRDPHRGAFHAAEELEKALEP